MSDVTMLQQLVAAAIKGYGEGDERSLQSAAGILGPSDLGFCRNKAALMTKGVELTDSENITPAQMGTAVHHYYGDALRAYFPDWIVDSRKLTATFPSGAEVAGTPDIIALNGVFDIKTTDGYEKVKRYGPSMNHRYQRHTYCLAAIQAGLIDESKPVYVGNIYVDRSGREEEPYVVYEEFDPTLTDEVDSWIQDVIYAVTNNEDAERDVAAPICQRICGYYSVCRGGLPVNDGGESITDEDRVDAIRMYVDGRRMETQGKKAKREASTILLGSNGTAKVDGKMMQVRWIHISASSYETNRDAYDRLDVRSLAGGKD